MGGGEGKSKKRRSSTSSGTQPPRDTYRIPYLVESVGSFCCGPSISFFLGLADEEGGERKRRDKKESKRRSRDDREDDDDRHKKKGKHIDRNKGKERDSKDRHSKEKTSKRKDKDAAFKEISKDDYFAKNNEFATWLKEEKGKYFSDLSSESARDLFLKFVKQWNKGKLPSQYYEGITSGPRSAHNWNIKA
uniref:Splicing factor arginine/serine-rich 12 n=1 Tax=Zea mays TaxID=4577 RepID=A0A804PG49_MAIZE